MSEYNAASALAAIASVAHEAGFTEEVTIARVRSLQRLPIKAGLYCLIFENVDYYVGKSVHLRQRLLQHSNRYDDIAVVRLKFYPKSRTMRADLDKQELRDIASFKTDLEPQGIRTRGIAHVTWTTAPTAFDSVMPPEAQEMWIADPFYVVPDAARREPHQDAPLLVERFERLRQHGRWVDIQRVIALYASRIIPMPRATEAERWSVSIFPEPTVAVRVNVGWQTAFDVYVGGHDKLQFAFYLPIEMLQRHFGVDQRKVYPDVVEGLAFATAEGAEYLFDQEPIGLTKGGAQQVLLSSADANDVLGFMALSEATAALRQFALGLAKQGPVSTATSHCTLLANEMLQALPEASFADYASPEAEQTVDVEALRAMVPVATLDGRFRLLERISAGGQGEVWRGLADERIECAVKLLPRPRLIAEREELARRFDDGAKAGRNVRGPHVCEMMASGTCAALPELGLPFGAHFIVLEYIGGGTLSDRYDRTNQFETIELRQLAFAVGSALSTAHELPQPIVHRDIKPENILLPGGDVARAKLADFGISRAEGDTQLTNVGSFVGTWIYMSPEQVASSWNAGPASDQYSLALVLWEFALDEVPGLRNTDLGTRRVRKRGFELETFEMNGKRCRNLEKVFARALEPDPDLRFPSIREFVRALDEAGVKDRMWKA